LIERKENKKMKTAYFLIEIQGGIEPLTRGPFRDEHERDDRAKNYHKALGLDDSLFWADVDEAGGLIVGSYTAGFFLEEYKQ
jgi:hypothetical protein